MSGECQDEMTCFGSDSFYFYDLESIIFLLFLLSQRFITDYLCPTDNCKEKLARFTNIVRYLMQGLGAVRILYSRIFLVFHNKFSSNGRAGLMLILSLFAIGQELFCTQ